MATVLAISAAVEGAVDEAVLRRVVAKSGGTLATVYGKQGKHHLRQRIAGYNNAARHAPWIVLVDLDREADCAPPLRQKWLPGPAPHLCFRIAVRAVESWLLADADALAAFLGVARSKVPSQPEALADPKSAMVTLARGSRRRDIREDMVPRPESGRAVGPAYASRLIEFAASHWQPAVAAGRAESLHRACRSLCRLIANSP
ncbi:MAG: hypothetical protein M0002_16115 [Rhodospirillales bacterium]|nr:hypothetical protein [Rhodospirillales bacterium]